MTERGDLIDHLVDVRDVLESYKCCQIVPLDWYKTLSTATDLFSSLPGRAGFGVVPELVDQLTIILEHGIEDTPMALNAAAEQVASALRQNIIPGMPRPEDESWAFQGPNAS